MLTSRFKQAGHAEGMDYILQTYPAGKHHPERVHLIAYTDLTAKEDMELVLKILAKNGQRVDGGGGGMLLDGKFNFQFYMSDKTDAKDFLASMREMSDAGLRIKGGIDRLEKEISKQSETLPQAAERDSYEVGMSEDGRSGASALKLCIHTQNVMSDVRVETVRDTLIKNGIIDFTVRRMGERQHDIDVAVDNKVQLAGLFRAVHDLHTRQLLRLDGGLPAAKQRIAETAVKLPTYTMPAQAPQR